MRKKLTDKQYLMLSQFAYLDFALDKSDFNDNYKGKTLGEVARVLQADEKRVYRSSGGLDNSEFRNLLKQIAEEEKNSVISDLIISAFEYKDNSTGFVAYAFTDKESEESLFAFRGSESHPAVGSGTVDWIDNIVGYGILNTSYQYDDVRNFVNTYKTNGQTYVTGHSKGGANAAYACAAIDGVTGIVFDAPGIGQTLSLEQASRLENSGLINCIAKNDIVGPLLFHPEQMKFCQQWEYFIGDDKLDGSGIADGHYTQAFMFNEEGYTMEDHRTVKSSVAGRLSKFIWYMKEIEFDPNKAKMVMTQLFCDDGDILSDTKDIIYEGDKLIKDIKELASTDEKGIKDFCKVAEDRMKLEFEKLVKKDIVGAFNHVAAAIRD